MSAVLVVRSREAKRALLAHYQQMLADIRFDLPDQKPQVQAPKR